MTQAFRAFLAIAAASIALPLLAPTPAAGQVPAARWAAVGPSGAVFRHLVIAPSAPATAYAAGAASGLFKSTDGGANWTRIDSGLPNRRVGALGVSATSAQVVFVAVEGGLYRSANGGTSWEPANDNLNDSAIQVIANHPQNGAILYAGTRFGGLFRSLDSGTNWSAVNGGLSNTNVRALAFDPFFPDTLYAGTADGIFRTTNGGSSWSATSTGLTDRDVRSLAVARGDADTLYAGTLSGVYRSLDSAAHWSAAQGSLPAGTILDLSVDSLDPNRVLAVGGGLYTTTNGGTDWTTVDLAAVWPGAVFALDNVSTLASRVLLAGAVGVLRSNDSGANFGVGHGGLNHSTATAVAGAANGDILYAALESSGLWRSVNGGAAWAPAASGLQVNLLAGLTVDPANEATLYAAGAGAGLYKSGDGGDNWAPIGPNNAGLNQVVLAQGPRTLYLATAGGVFESIDEGGSWTADANGLADARVWSLAVDPAVTTNLYAGTPVGLFESLDGGAGWSATTTSLGSLDVRAVVLDPVNPLNVVIGTAAGTVFRSADGAGTWSSAATGLPGGAIAALLIDPSSPVVVFAATPSGVFRSTDGGATFVAFDDGWVSGVAATGLAVDASGRYLVAATAGGGVYRYPLWVTFSDGFESGNASAWSTATP